MNHEIDTGDENLVSKTFTSKCTRCITGVADFKDMLDGGHRIRGAHLHLVKIVDAVPTYSSIVTVTVTESEDAGDLYDSRGHAVRHFNAVGAVELVFNLKVDQPSPQIWQLDLVTH